MQQALSGENTPFITSHQPHLHSPTVQKGQSIFISYFKSNCQNSSPYFEAQGFHFFPPHHFLDVFLMQIRS